MVVSIDGRMVPVIGMDDLVRNKEAAGRPKDQVDVLWLRTKVKK